MAPSKRSARLLDQDYDLVPIGKLQPHPDNPNRGASELIADSIDTNGFYGAVLAQRSTGRVLAGNHRLAQLQAAGAAVVPVIWLDVDDDHALRIMLADNETTRAGGYDRSQLLELLRGVAQSPSGLRGTGFTQSALAKLAAAMTDRPDTPSLADRFVVPPFTVLDAKQGYWQDRKTQWLALGFNSGSGRGAEGDPTALDGLTYHEGHEPPHVYEAKNALEQQLGRTLTWPEFYDAAPELATGHKDSHFDPVLAELAVRWFCPAGGTVLDPFAGEIVKGLVAVALGYDYTGVELRPEQVQANVQGFDAVRSQVAAAAAWSPPNWIVGDSADLNACLPAGATYDLLFTSPPYWNLEQYSDRSDDGSTMSYPAFLEWYRDVFHAACERLADNRFAVVKIGDVRHPDGGYANLLGDTITCFLDAGLVFYNEAVLLTPIGSFAMKSGRQFQAGRKLTRVHQNVLVFYKGDARHVKRHFPQLDLPDAVPS